MGGSAGTTFGLTMVVTVMSLAVIVSRWTFSFLRDGSAGEERQDPDR